MKQIQERLNLRAQYFDAEPAQAQALREYHVFEGEWILEQKP